MKRLLHEPLLQFLIIGAIVFALYGLVQDRTALTAPETILVSKGRIAQLAETFTRTWQRPPSAEELNGLVDAFVKEEIFYREGRKLGLDTDDTVFRRRLQQKMEFLMEPTAEELTPAQNELQTYLVANRDKFRIPAQVAFEQVYFDPRRHNEDAGAAARRAAAALKRLQDGVDPRELGDPSLLPASMPLVTFDRVAISFGQQFAEELGEASSGDWGGPIQSTFGLHLVRVSDRRDARDPALVEVIDEVTREWEAERRAEIAEQRYSRLREGYEVVVEADPSDAAKQEAGSSASR